MIRPWNLDAMRAALREAQQYALPDISEREKLTQRIVDLADVKAMADDELALLEAEHEREIVSLVGAIDSKDDDTDWNRRARQALRILRLHQRWITREREERKKKATAKEIGDGLRSLSAAKMDVSKAIRESQLLAADARRARIAAANDENNRNVSVFKAVALEVLGTEMYEHLWELTRERLSQG